MNRTVLHPLLLLTCLLVIYKSYPQNLPSLLLNKNINATFSITGYDKEKQEWGIAVATNNIYVGNSTIYIQPGLGAFSVIAETEPAYAINGFEQLKKGKEVQQAIEYTRQRDEESYERQVAGIDANGHVYAFTGAALQYWQGHAAHYLGNNFVVMGNQLAPNVLTAMADTFTTATGTLAQRLLKSLIAGQHAGGQITGKQSAAVVVKGSNNEWFNQVDIRADNSKTPCEDLQQLLNYHYGRITLNQSLNALKAGNNKRGETLLHQAETQLEGWNGIYSKIAMAYILLGNEEKAVSIIQKAIAENALWVENLPSFYCLYKHPEISRLKSEDTFSIKDWNNAIQLMIGLNNNKEAIELAAKVLKKHPGSSYTYYLLGKANAQTGDKKAALLNAKTALQLDINNAEARSLLKELSR